MPFFLVADFARSWHTGALKGRLLVLLIVAFALSVAYVTIFSDAGASGHAGHAASHKSSNGKSGGKSGSADAARLANMVPQSSGVYEPRPEVAPAKVLQERLGEVAPAPYTLRINVFTYNRLEGLERLLRSLKRSFYPGVDPRSGQLPMHIYFDYPAKADMTLDHTRAFLDEFRWPYGPLVIHRRERNIGLRGNILESWYPAPNGRPINELKEYAAFFEDDIEVSPYWFVWADKGIREYSSAFAGPTKENSKMLGLSLYRYMKDELSGRVIEFPDNEPFLLQQPSSWGAVFFPEAWREFRQWMQTLPPNHNPNLYDPSDPSIDPSSNGWAQRTSWKKYLIYQMYQRGWFMVYPNLPERTVLSTNHLMKGVHPVPSKKHYLLPIFPPVSLMSAEDLAAVVDESPADPLARSPKAISDALMKFPPLSEMVAYDVMHARRGKGPKAIPNHGK